MNRRQFLNYSTGAVAAFPYVTSAPVLGANNRIQLGFVGLGGRAKWLIQNEEFPGAEIVALADCALPRTQEAAALKPEGARWRKYQDYRQMFEREKLDAVFVETTTHARVLIMIEALQAGLDVYGEKPLTLTIAEGRALVDATRRYHRVLQTGSQQRSIPINAWASQRIREGVLGKVRTVLTYNFQAPIGWYPKPAQTVPEGLDWNQWCNQTELRPYHKQLQYQWLWYWDYDGGGQSWGVTGWGAHSLDQVQCALGTDDTGPVEIEPEDSSRESKMSLRYAGGTVVLLEGVKREHADLGAIFLGDNGKIEIKRGSCSANPPELLKGAPPNTPEGPGECRDHIQNFLDCMRTRQKPNADAEIGHRSTSVCHLINISRDLGQKLKWDPKSEKFPDNEQANALLARSRRKRFELPKIT